MNIAGRKIDSSQPPYVVAEISGNHCGNLDTALQLIKAAKDVGADAVKFQCYTPDELTLDSGKPDFVIRDGLWKGRRLYDLYESAYTPREWFGWLFEQGKRCGITVFSSVFSREGVDFLEEFDCPAYKIASMEIVDRELIKYAYATGKPLIISTGMVSQEDHDDRKSNDNRGNPLWWGWKKNTALLHCVSGYPTPIEEARLGLDGLRGLWLHCPIVGISDHTKGVGIPIAATALGVCIIEKHFTLDRNNGSEDAEFSLEPGEFKQMVQSVKNVWKAMQPSEPKSEVSSRQLRRSLYVVRSIKKGEVFTDQNIRSIRPSYGLPPSEIFKILGQCATRDIERGDALTWEMVDASLSKPTA